MTSLGEGNKIFFDVRCIAGGEPVPSYPAIYGLKKTLDEEGNEGCSIKSWKDGAYKVFDQDWLTKDNQRVFEKCKAGGPAEPTASRERSKGAGADSFGTLCLPPSCEPLMVPYQQHSGRCDCY